MTPLLELNRPGQRSMHAHSHAGWAVWEGRPLLMVEAHYCQLVTQRIMFKASPSQAVRLAAVQLALMNPWATLTSASITEPSVMALSPTRQCCSPDALGVP